MKIEAIKNINITVLFSTPINHSLVSQADILNMFKSGDSQKDQHTFVEAPGLKAAVFPNLKKEIIFEANRFLVNDKSDKIEETQIVGDLQKIINSNMIEQNKIAAFGFNYDAVVAPQSVDFKIDDLVGEKVSKIQGIKSAGINVSYEKNNALYVLEIKPLKSEGDEKKFFAHFNAHFNVNKFPSKENLESDVKKQYDEFKDIIEKI